MSATLSYGDWEATALQPVKAAARSRLGAAIQAERRTAHLPPSCESRAKAIQELHWAEAVAAEMGI